MPPFEESLREYLQTHENLRQRGASEDSLRDAFLSFLRRAFPRLSTAESLQLEKYIPGLRVRGGFADVLYEDLIFEFKRQIGPDQKNEGEAQLARYLGAQPHPERFFGILTDGRELQVYAWREEKLLPIDTLTLDATTPEKIAYCQLWLDSYLFHERAVEPTTEDIVRRFGEHSPTFHQGIRLLAHLWQESQTDPAAQTKLAEWQNLLSLVYGSKIEDHDLFLRHTYLALFARMLVAVVLDQKAPTAGDLPHLISGEAFRRKGLENFGQADFFLWMRPEHPHLQAFLQAIALRLTSTYDLSSISEDLLKGLYQQLVDPKTRHDLGEFYTPDWLAELTLQKSGFLDYENPSVLDPACGSGTFLFTAIRLQSRKYQGHPLVEWALSNLAGLDIHPLAVFIAQTNFLLALRPHLKGYSKRLIIPIYMADALSLPEKEGATATIRLSVPLQDLKQKTGKEDWQLADFFEVPLRLAQRPEAFHQALSALLDLAQPHLPEDKARSGLTSRLEKLQADLHLAASDMDIPAWQRNLRLMRWLLKEPPTDSVWGFLLRNASQPALLAHRKFAFLAGNPPWLAYRYVQRPDYQKRLRTLLTQTYQLATSHETHLFTHMELATLFFAVCERHYLQEGGTLAFVMPRSILTGAKQHAIFQSRYLAAAHLILDCEKVSPLFNVPTCVVIYKKPPPPPSPTVPLLKLEGTLPTHNPDWNLAQNYLYFTQSTFTPLKTFQKSPYLPKIINGASIIPRTFWFVRPPEKAEVIDKSRPQLETDPAIRRQAKEPWKKLSLHGEVEATYLYATLLSDDLLPFGSRKLALIVLPLHHKSLRSYEDAIAHGDTGLANWLQQAIHLWETYRKSQEELLPYINWQNKLTAQTPVGPYKLLYNTSGTHLAACAINTRALTKEHLIYNLPIQGFVAQHTTYWFETQDAKEAHYLCAILNAPSIDSLIKPFQPKGMFGAQKGRGERHICRLAFEVVPIPLYDSTNRHHRELAELSEVCHGKVEGFIAEAGKAILTMRVGILRQKVRAFLSEELKTIDALTKTLFHL